MNNDDYNYNYNYTLPKNEQFAMESDPMTHWNRWFT